MKTIAVVLVSLTFVVAIAVLFGPTAISSVDIARLGPITPVTAPGSGNPEQAWAHADPANARYLIVCGDIRDPADNLLGGYISTSADGGVTWRRTLLENSTKFVSEESCAYGSHDAAYFIAGASNYYNGEPHHETGHMHFYASRDGGLTWAHTWTRRDGWLDWTSIAVSSVSGSNTDKVIVFANSGTDRLGHWMPRRPVAIQSDNGGQSFTNLIAPHPAGFQYIAVWTGENVVLPDGTALFATSAARGPVKGKITGWANGEVAVEIFSYDPAHHRVASRAVLRVRHNVPIFTAALAQDRSSGHFNGRLYAAWVEEDAYASALWLATSDDRGYHWKMRPILRGRGSDYPAGCATDQPIDQVELATTPDGTLGIMWMEDVSTVHFATSRDGGATFEASVTLASVDASRLVPDEAITWNDYWLEATLVEQAGKPSPQNAWVNTLGLGVVVRPSTIGDLSLVAGRNNRFHAFWIAPHGIAQSLMTRTIAVEGGGAGKAMLSTPAIAVCATKSAAVLARPALPQSLPKIALPGGHEITSSIGLDPLRYAYDPAMHTVTVDAVIVNKGKTTLRAPIMIVGVNPHSDFGEARVTNATGSIDGQPYWNASPLVSPTGLAPGMRSKPLHVVVAISGFHPLPSNYLEGDAFSMAIRAYTKQFSEGSR